MKHFIRIPAHIPALTLGALALAATFGCTQSPADDPAFQAQVKKLDALGTDVQEANRRISALSTMDTELQQISKDIATLKSAGPGGNTEAVAAIDRRLGPLETKLNALTEAVGALQQRASTVVASQSTPPATGSHALAKSAPPSSTAEKGAAIADNVEAAASGGSAKTTASAANAGAGRAPSVTVKAPARSGAAAKRTRTGTSSGAPSVSLASGSSSPSSHGQYYMLKSGDTPDSLAKQFGVAGSTILAANQLPAGSKLIGGQTIFIPGR